MAGCPLCILGVPEAEHTSERWASITDEERAIVHAHWAANPGVTIVGAIAEHRRQREEALRAREAT